MCGALLSRGLILLGGTLLATVVGWLISTAAASADTLPFVPAAPAPVTSALGTAHHVVAGVLPAHPRPAHPRATVAHGALSLRTTPGQAADGVRGVTGALGDAVKQLRAHVPGRSVVAPLNVLPALPVATPTPVRAGSTSTPAGDRAPDRAASVAAADVPPPAHIGAVSARSQVDRSPVAPPAPHTDAAPARPSPGPAPWHPVPVPPATGGGAVGAPGPGGLGLLDESGTWPGPGFDLVPAVEASTPLGTPSPGRQPGITPD